MHKLLITGVVIAFSSIALIAVVFFAVYQPLTQVYRIKERDLAQAITMVGELSPNSSDDRKEQRRHLQHVFTKSAEATVSSLNDHSNDKILHQSREELKRRFTAVTPCGVQTATGMRPATREDYIYEAPCREGWANVQTVSSGTEEVTLWVDPNLELDQNGLRCAWTQVSWLVHEYSVPILLPSNIAIREDDQLRSSSSVKLTFGDQEAGTIIVDHQSRHGAVVAERDLLPLWLHRMLQSEVIQETLTLDRKRQNAWVLPRWTYPLLSAAKITAQSEESIIMNDLIDLIIKN